MYETWQAYKTNPCSHFYAHIFLHGRYVCMGCASPNSLFKPNKITTMGLTHELPETEEIHKMGASV